MNKGDDESVTAWARSRKFYLFRKYLRLYLFEIEPGLLVHVESNIEEEDIGRLNTLGCTLLVQNLEQ